MYIFCRYKKMCKKLELLFCKVAPEGLVWNYGLRNVYKYIFVDA